MFTRISRPRALALLLGLWGASHGCTCGQSGGDLAPAPNQCMPERACPTGQAFRQGRCVPQRCTRTEDCCPGQVCFDDTGLCASQLVECTSDEQCEGDRRCIDFRGGQYCGLPNRQGVLSASGTQRCDSDDDCTAGRSCLGARCVETAPCGGGCPGSEVCDIDSNQCFPLSCDLRCAPGELLVLADPDTQSGPNCCAPSCACATLPPVPWGTVGWHADLTVAQGTPVMSAYDQYYGDLVVVYFDETAGTPSAIEYVDGIPADAPQSGDPTGPRDGRFDAGPNVGRYSSITTDAEGFLHIAYYDVDEKRLKYAHNRAGAWRTQVVDEDGDTGLYTSVRIDDDGRPHIAYMQREGQRDGERVGALRYAVATTVSPERPSDWRRATVDHQPLRAPICGGGCDADEACVDLGEGPACTPTTDRCGGACGPAESCVAAPGGARCRPNISLTPLDDLPEGTGLFADLRLVPGQGPVIGYYDRVRQKLRRAKQNFDAEDPAQWQRRTVDFSSSDRGQHLSLAFGPEDALFAAYFDASQDQLLFRGFDPVTASEIVDDGVTDEGLHRVGADAALAFDPQGEPIIVYQDASGLDLKWARRVDGAWLTETLVGANAAAGFYARLVIDRGIAYITHVEVGFDDAGELDLRPRLLRRAL